MGLRRPDRGPLPARWISVWPPRCGPCLRPNLLNPTSSLRLAIAYSWPNHSEAGKTLCRWPPTSSFLTPTSGPCSRDTPGLLALSLPTLDRSSASLGLFLSKCPLDGLSPLLWACGLNQQAPMPRSLSSVGDQWETLAGQQEVEERGSSQGVPAPWQPWCLAGGLLCTATLSCST